MLKCARRSCNKEFVGPKNKRYCSKKCVVNERVTRLRREYKRRAVEMLGGKCSRCGYDACLRALQFHHLDPLQKKFGLAACGRTRKWVEYEEEALKCILLCANCHAEEEDRIYWGVAQLAQHVAVTHADHNDH